MQLTECAGNIGGFKIHLETGEIFMTDGWRRLVGLPSGVNLLIQEAIEFYHPDDQVDVRQTVTQVAETKSRYVILGVLRRVTATNASWR